MLSLHQTTLMPKSPSSGSSIAHPRVSLVLLHPMNYPPHTRVVMFQFVGKSGELPSLTVLDVTWPRGWCSLGVPEEMPGVPWRCYPGYQHTLPATHVSVGTLLGVEVVLYGFPDCFLFCCVPLFSWIYAVLSHNLDSSARINQKFSQNLRLIWVGRNPEGSCCVPVQ